jgi:hypothetical protein
MDESQPARARVAGLCRAQPFPCCTRLRPRNSSHRARHPCGSQGVGTTRSPRDSRCSPRAGWSNILAGGKTLRRSASVGSRCRGGGHRVRLPRKGPGTSVPRTRASSPRSGSPRRPRRASGRDRSRGSMQCGLGGTGGPGSTASQTGTAARDPWVRRFGTHIQTAQLR